MIYLASPYTDPDPNIVEDRFNKVCQACSILMSSNELVFSPIAHCHPIAKYGLPKEWSFWEKYDKEMIDLCSRVMVLMLPGWMESVGVRAEIDYAKQIGKSVSYMEFERS